MSGGWGPHAIWGEVGPQCALGPPKASKTSDIRVPLVSSDTVSVHKHQTHTVGHTKIPRFSRSDKGHGTFPAYFAQSDNLGS